MKNKISNSRQGHRGGHGKIFNGSCHQALMSLCPNKWHPPVGQKTPGANQGTHLSGQGQRQMVTLQLIVYFYAFKYPKQSNYSFLSLIWYCFHDYYLSQINDIQMRMGRLSQLIWAHFKSSLQQMASLIHGMVGFGGFFQMVPFPNPVPIPFTLGYRIEIMQSFMNMRLTRKKTIGEILVGFEVGRPNFLLSQFGTGRQGLSLVRAGSYCRSVLQNYSCFPPLAERNEADTHRWRSKKLCTFLADRWPPPLVLLHEQPLGGGMRRWLLFQVILFWLQGHARPSCAACSWGLWNYLSLST